MWAAREEIADRAKGTRAPVRPLQAKKEERRTFVRVFLFTLRAHNDAIIFRMYDKQNNNRAGIIFRATTGESAARAITPASDVLRPISFQRAGTALVRISLGVDKRFNEPRKNTPQSSAQSSARDVRAFLTSSYRRFNRVFNAPNRSLSLLPSHDSHPPRRGDVFKAGTGGGVPSLSVVSAPRTNVITVCSSPCEARLTDSSAEFVILR